MLKPTLLYTLCLCFPIFIVGQVTDIDYSGDTKSINSIVSAYYEVLSGPTEIKRDWSRFANLFHSNAVIVLSGYLEDEKKNFAFNSLSPDVYISQLNSFWVTHDYYLIEHDRQTKQFGNLGQVFSSYASRFEKLGENATTGINSFQMIFDGNRWWISSVIEQTDLKGHETVIE